MELLFIRNAESEGDDDRLTSRGFAMARQVGQTLQSLKVSHVFGSSLPSDKVTSDFLTLYHNLSCETIKNFKDLENGEPPEQFSARVSKAFRELLEKKVGKNELICIVSHEKPLNIMLKEFLGIQDRVPHFHLDFCSISRVALVNGECHVFSINETSHLTSAPHPSF